MKKILIITIIAILPSLAFSATTTASVGGTLKVYQTLAAALVQDMIFPAQFAGTATNLINGDGAAPATGIPNVAGDTQGRAGKASVTGTGGTVFSSAIATPINLTNGANTLSTALTLWNEAGYLTAAPTAIPGSGNGQVAYIFVKGLIATGSMVAGVYTGSAALTITYN